jgi:hypothetical protein
MANDGVPNFWGGGGRPISFEHVTRNAEKLETKCKITKRPELSSWSIRLNVNFLKLRPVYLYVTFNPHFSFTSTSYQFSFNGNNP